MFAIFNHGEKPSNSVSKDLTRPRLTAAELVRYGGRDRADGSTEPVRWEVQATDSYQLVRVAVEVRDPGDGPDLIPGPIPVEALKAAEKTGAFMASADTVTPVDRDGVVAGPAYYREPDIGQFPNVEQLTPNQGVRPFTIGLDAELLFRLARSLGAKNRLGARVTLTFTNDTNGTPNPLRPMVVRAKDGNPDSQGLLMPLRVGR